MSNSANDKREVATHPPSERQAPPPCEETPAFREPVQLDLFSALIGGGGWSRETSHESAPSREFVLPPASATAPGDPIVAGFQIQMSLESGNLTIVVTVQISGEARARVDRDRDFFLREFMEGSDE
jgi:hypothetical protein